MTNGPERSHSSDNSDWKSKERGRDGDIDFDGDVLSLFFFLFSVLVLALSLLTMIIRRLRHCSQRSRHRRLLDPTAAGLDALAYVVDEETVEKHCPSFVWNQGCSSTSCRPTDDGCSLSWPRRDLAKDGVLSPPLPLTEEADGGPSGISFVCAICLESVQEGDHLRKLRCHHMFHTTCVDAWLLRGRGSRLPQCPQCRRLAWIPEGAVTTIPPRSTQVISGDYQNFDAVVVQSGGEHNQPDAESHSVNALLPEQIGDSGLPKSVSRASSRSAEDEAGLEVGLPEVEDENGQTFAVLCTRPATASMIAA